jgi:hypothetical protein
VDAISGPQARVAELGEAPEVNKPQRHIFAEHDSNLADATADFSPTAPLMGKSTSAVPQLFAWP